MTFRPAPFVVAPTFHMAKNIARERGWDDPRKWNFMGPNIDRIRGHRRPHVIVYLAEVRNESWWPELRGYLMIADAFIEVYEEDFRGRRNT